MQRQFLDYEGQEILVIGGASGMGAAAAALLAELGARVMVLDVVAVDSPALKSVHLDLRRKDSVDAALAVLDANFKAVFACAGVADGVKGIVQINFLGQRRLIEGLLQRGQLRQGGAVVMISSVAGLAWHSNLATLLSFLSCESWEDAESWLASHDGNDNYAFSKQAMNAYVASRAMSFLQRGVRLNAVMPGPTDTPLAQAHADTWLAFGDRYRKSVGVSCLQPEQVASVMLFLASGAAAGVNGCSLLVDHGHMAAVMSGTFEEPAFAV